MLDISPETAIPRHVRGQPRVSRPPSRLPRAEIGFVVGQYDRPVVTHGPSIAQALRVAGCGPRIGRRWKGSCFVARTGISWNDLPTAVFGASGALSSYVRPGPGAQEPN